MTLLFCDILPSDKKDGRKGKWTEKEEEGRGEEQGREGFKGGVVNSIGRSFVHTRVSIKKCKANVFSFFTESEYT